MEYIFHCNTCGLRDPSQNICLLHKHQVDPNEDFCSKHRQVYRCEHCGSITLSPIIEVDNDTIHLWCMNCSQERNTCSFCVHNNICSFENDPSPLPKVVMKTMNQGNMYVQTQVRNPERIRETCQKNCECFDAENGCLRQNNYCTGYCFSGK